MRKKLGVLLVAGLVYWIFFVYERPLEPSDALLEREFASWQRTLDGHGIEVERSHRTLNYEQLPHGRVGRTLYLEQKVSLDYSVVDPWLIKAILWHELGHFYFALPHGSCRIMDERANPPKYYQENWPALEEEYINLIKEKQ